MKHCPSCNEEIKGKVTFCPSCGEKIGRASAADKKSRLTEKKKKGSPLLTVAAGAALVAVIALGAFFVLRPSSTPVSASSAPGGGAAGNEVVTFPVSAFVDGTAKYYSYNASGGKTIRFFLLKSSDGVIRAAFDACDVCYASKKGYRQEGDFMVCNNCGQRFTSVRINEVRGGCNPAPIERRIEGDQVVIRTATLLSGANYF